MSLGRHTLSEAAIPVKLLIESEPGLSQHLVVIVAPPSACLAAGLTTFRATSPWRSAVRLAA